MKNPSHTDNHSNQEQKIINFFKKEIEKETLALYIRRLLFVISKNALESQESGLYFEWLSKSHFWLNELAECLDPYLDKEE